MSILRRVSTAVALLVMSGSLTGCGSVSSFLAGGMADLIPAWAGGLPADAPPRPGTAEYDAYIRQREQKAQAPAAPEATASPSVGAAH